MSNKQFKTYCRIIDYIDVIDPELATILRGLCADMTLGSLKGKPGITFLLPQDKTFRQKLEKLAFSEKVEDANKASDMINALIIRDVFKSPAEWKSKEVPNSLLPPQVVDVASTTAKEVHFGSGAIAVLDTGFKDSSRRQNLAVWFLKSGEIPVTTDKPAQIRQFRRGPYPKTGSYDPGRLDSQSERFKIALALENGYALCRLQHEAGTTPSHRDIYLEYTLSLVHYIQHVRKDVALLTETVIPLLSFDKIDMYILLEPFHSSGATLLSDDLIHEWWLQKDTVKCKPTEVIKDVEDLLTSGSGALVYTDREGLLAKLADIRQTLSQTIEQRPRSTVTEIEKYYVELEKNNTIGGLGPVYPATLHQYYAGKPGLKMLHDELRYLMFASFRSLERGRFDIGRFHEIVNMVAECLFAATADERAKSQKLLNKNTLTYLIAPNEMVQDARTFVFSTMFLYFPITKKEAENLKTKNSISRPDPENVMLWNISLSLYNQHARILAGKDKDNLDLISALRSLDVNKLDPALREELKKKLSQ